MFEFGIDARLIGLGIALGLGFLVGIEREWAEDKPVGVRSFALISAAGGMSTFMLEMTGGWPLAAGLLALGLILATHAHARQFRGITTLIAALIVFLIGAAAVAGFWLESIVLGGLVTLLLHWKEPLHGWVERLGRKDFGIIARFVLIALVILPVLPDRSFGPYGVFNPFRAWLLVVLIVAINLTGYVLFRLIGARAGAWVAGLVGGLVSSTATTLSYAGISRRHARLAGVAALVILVASTVVYGRVILELGVVAPALVASIAAPSAVFSVVMLALSVVVYLQIRGEAGTEMPEQKNPARIKLALGFAALYVLILFAVAAARDLVGGEALYAVAFASGLTDVDALTLSVGQLFARGEIEADRAWRLIFLATLSNLAFKIAAASLLGSPALRRRILGIGTAALAAGALIIWQW